MQFFYCLSDVLGKKYLITYIDHLYLFLFKIGIIGLIPMITFGIITLFINIDEKYQLFLIFNSTDIWINLLDLFFSFMFQLGLWLTIFYLTPCHYIIYESISNFLEIFLDKIEGSIGKYSNEEIITFYILYPILIFGTFVFNEIIILNIFGLNSNTTNEIILRGNMDDINQRDTFCYDIEDDDYKCIIRNGDEDNNI